MLCCLKPPEYWSLRYHHFQLKCPKFLLSGEKSKTHPGLEQVIRPWTFLQTNPQSHVHTQGATAKLTPAGGTLTWKPYSIRYLTLGTWLRVAHPASMLPFLILEWSDCSAWKYFVLGYGINLPLYLSCNLCSIFYSCYLAWLFGMVPFAHFGPYLVSQTCIILLWDAGERSLLEPAAPSWVLSVSPHRNNLWLWVTGL